MDCVVSYSVEGFERWMLMTVPRMLIGLEFKRSSDPGREWTESFEVIIERENINETAL